MKEEDYRAERMREEARACFDRWAEEYDRCFLHRYIRKVQERITREMSPGEDAFILDVGCGTGEGLLLLRHRVKKGLLAGLDISPRMIEVAGRKFSGQEGIDLRVGDAEMLPWPDSSFDEAISTFTLHHFPHPDRALVEIARVLRPGGHLFLADLILPRLLRRALNWILQLVEGAAIQVQTLDSLRDLFLQASFDPTSPRRLAPCVYLFIGEKKSPDAKAKGTGIV
jgi:ubiquinone/menaquinone biosynthesis C-methylase UbiE